MTVLCKAYMKIDSTANRRGVLANATSTVAPTHWLPPAVCRVYSMWGALFDTAWITPADVPAACAHSIDDTTISYISGFNKRNGNYLLYGSFSINQRAVNIGLPTALHSFNSGKHDLGLKSSALQRHNAAIDERFFL